jgi:hypothetical protein
MQLAAVPAAATIATVGFELEPAALFSQFGWTSLQTYGDRMGLQSYVLQQLVLPAVVLIAGGTIAAVRLRGNRR